MKTTSGKRIEEVLYRTRLKQIELAERTGINQSYFSDCKNGRVANISMEKAAKIHAIFPQFPIEWLRGITDELPAEATERPTQSAIASGDHAVGFQFNTEEGLVPSLLRQLEAKDKIIHMQMQQILSLTALVGAQK